MSTLEAEVPTVSSRVTMVSGCSCLTEQLNFIMAYEGLEWDYSTAWQQFWPQALPDATRDDGNQTQVCQAKVQYLNHYATQLLPY